MYCRTKSDMFKKWIRTGFPSSERTRNKIPKIHPTFLRFHVADEWIQDINQTERPITFLRVTNPPKLSNEAEKFILVRPVKDPFKKYLNQILF